MFNNKSNYPVTGEDGLVVWVSRAVVVISMVTWKDNILIVHRADNPNISSPNKWCMPCGYLDWDETIEQAVVRETYEETGLDIRNYSNNGINRNDIVSDPISLKQDVSIHYLTEMMDDDLPVLDLDILDKDEIVYAKWVYWRDVFDMDFAFKHDNMIIKHFTV